ncbi:hypothetical protein [Streptomyces kaniharaensis]|uniref:hypothetical protein n=1 Tax=Streptomyces kaniharaensis TaxID=212423 RepID=UPI001296C332|nr:hypothetical protein [Streptomyces kaniharaensis]
MHRSVHRPDAPCAVARRGAAVRLGTAALATTALGTGALGSCPSSTTTPPR